MKPIAQLTAALTIALTALAPVAAHAATSTGTWGPNKGDCSHAYGNSGGTGFASTYINKTSGGGYCYARFKSSYGLNTKQIQVRGKCYSWNSFGYGTWVSGWNSSAHKACSNNRQPYASSCRVRVIY